MRKLERAFRLFSVAAIMGLALFLPSRPASAQTYSMQDYYIALAAVEYDYMVIGDLNSQISMLQGNIDSTNSYYEEQIRLCASGFSYWGPPKTQAQIEDCQQGYYQEWYMWIWPMEMEMSGLQQSMGFAQMQLGNDEQLLGLIKAALGIP
jgi:hypothetical protein